jgi:hypothetical protein
VLGAGGSSSRRRCTRAGGRLELRPCPKPDGPRRVSGHIRACLPALFTIKSAAHFGTARPGRLEHLRNAQQLRIYHARLQRLYGRQNTPPSQLYISTSSEPVSSICATKSHFASHMTSVYSSSFPFSAAPLVYKSLNFTLVPSLVLFYLVLAVPMNRLCYLVYLTSSQTSWHLRSFILSSTCMESLASIRFREGGAIQYTVQYTSSNTANGTCHWL